MKINSFLKVIRWPLIASIKRAMRIFSLANSLNVECLIQLEPSQHLHEMIEMNS